MTDRAVDDDGPVPDDSHDPDDPGDSTAPENASFDADGDVASASDDADADEPLPAAREAVGDGRTKYVEVVGGDGERHEHGDALVREDANAFYVSEEPGFPAEDTVIYEKAELARVSVEQHHSACFVTTAVAGEEATLGALRGFRDDALRPSPVGRPLVGVYEAVSPPIADTLASNPGGRTARVVRALVRRCAALARRRERAGPTGAAALSVVLTLLYVVGVTVAAAGHLATVATAGVGRSRRR